MKKLIFLIVCALSFNVMGDVGNPIFDINNQEIIGTETEQDFIGSPIVLIEKEEKQKPEINRAQLLPPPDLAGNKIQIPIKTPFGHNQKAAFIDHITDFVSFIQFLDKETVKVTEQIQFVTTKEGSPFEQFFPNDLMPEILSVSQDQAALPFEEIQKDNGVVLRLKNDLKKGIHRITIQYLLKNVIKNNKSLIETNIPVLSGSQDDMIERLTAMIMLPGKANFYKKEVLFGSNNVSIPEAIKMTEDLSKNIVIQITHPLPAHTNMKVHLLFDANALPSGEGKQLPENYLVIGIYFIVLAIYGVLSIFACRFKKWKKPLAESKKISPVLWTVALGGKLSKTIIDYLKNQKINLWCLDRFGCLTRIVGYFRFNMEYVFGVSILIIATKIMSHHYNVNLAAGEKGILIALGVITLIIIDLYGTRVELKNLKEKLKEILLNTPQGLNLAPRDIQPYYIKAVCFEFDILWKKRLIMNNPSYNQLAFLKKEKP